MSNAAQDWIYNKEHDSYEHEEYGIVMSGGLYRDMEKEHGVVDPQKIQDSTTNFKELFGDCEDEN